MRRFPIHLWIGLLLIAIFWWINWGMDGVRSHWAFFPLWLGYILTIDGLAVRIGRPSMAAKTKSFVMLFVLSAPIWWAFEFINDWVHYWEYIPADRFKRSERILWSTLSFSTVIPAIFVTANILSGFSWFKRHHFQLEFGSRRADRLSFFIAGVVMAIVIVIWPQYAMAFVWMSLFFLLDPINHALGNKSLLRQTATGDWRTVIIFFAASLVCGFFWEMWNIYSWPKWVYTFPYLNGLKVFEMPLAGYLGYLPFALELYALVALIGPVLKIDVPKYIEG